MTATRPVLLQCDHGLCIAEFEMSGIARGGFAAARRRAAAREGWTTAPGPYGGTRDYCADHWPDQTVSTSGNGGSSLTGDGVRSSPSTN